MVATDPNRDPRRSGENLLSVRALVLVLIATSIGLAWVHNPLWGAGAIAAVTALGILAAIVG